MNFGETLKIFLYVGKIKMKDLASVLEYDPSYISKWTSGHLLPNRKLSSLLLTKASYFLADQILTSKKDIHWPDYFDAKDVPENIETYHDLQSFIFKTLMASYNQSDKLAHAMSPDESEFFVERNTSTSYDLNDIIMTIHGTCSNAINKYETLRIISSLPTTKLAAILDSQIKSYCMMFRSKNIHLRYYMDIKNHPLTTIEHAYEIMQRLLSINPQSQIDIYTKPEDMASFICTEGCYIIYQTNILGRTLYHMINEENSVSLFSDHILNYPYDETPLLTLMAPTVSTPSIENLKHLVTGNKPLRLYLPNPKTLENMKMILTSSPDKATQNNPSSCSLYHSIYEQLQHAPVEIYLDNTTISSLFAHPPAILQRYAKDITFIVTDRNLLDTQDSNTSVLLGSNALFFAIPDTNLHNDRHHFLISTAPDLIEHINQQFTLLKSHHQTTIYKLDETLNLIQQDKLN